MTGGAALERAVRLWGSERVISVAIRADGSTDVNCRPAMRAASDVRGRNYCAHRLDANGHTACHDDCRLLES